MNWITSTNVITLNNLPLNLTKLEINSKISYAINNLNQLKFSGIKFNLEYLPEKLKILILQCDDNIYNLEDLANLLISLELI